MNEDILEKLLKERDKVELLSEIEVPKKFYQRLTLGVKVLDELFGGKDMPGVIPGTSFLVTGLPGAGKSTMCLQLADLFKRNAGLTVLYNVGEESRNMVKLRAERIKIAGDFCISEYDDVDELIEYCKLSKVEVLFQDSLQSIADGDLKGFTKWKSVTKKLHKLAKERDLTVFIVGHITKGGSFAGPQEIKHDVDAHVSLTFEPNSGSRVFQLEKNRFGPASVPYDLLLDANGLDFAQAKEIDVSGPNKRDDRKEQIASLIKQKLFEGEKISGYCFERFEVDCSGGYWRGVLDSVVVSLRKEGIELEEERIDGRKHYFLKV